MQAPVASSRDVVRTPKVAGAMVALRRTEVLDHARFRLPLAPRSQDACPFGTIPRDPLAGQLHELPHVRVAPHVPRLPAVAVRRVFGSGVGKLNETAAIGHVLVRTVPAKPRPMSSTGALVVPLTGCRLTLVLAEYEIWPSCGRGSGPASPPGHGQQWARLCPVLDGTGRRQSWLPDGAEAALLLL